MKSTIRADTIPTQWRLYALLGVERFPTSVTWSFAAGILASSDSNKAINLTAWRSLVGTNFRLGQYGQIGSMRKSTGLFSAVPRPTNSWWVSHQESLQSITVAMAWYYTWQVKISSNMNSWGMMLASLRAAFCVYKVQSPKDSGITNLNLGAHSAHGRI